MIVAISAMTSDGDIYSSRDFRESRINILPCKMMKRNYTPGYLNHLGEFLNEEQALIEARLCNQIKNIYFAAKNKLLSHHLL